MQLSKAYVAACLVAILGVNLGNVDARVAKAEKGGHEDEHSRVQSGPTTHVDDDRIRKAGDDRHDQHRERKPGDLSKGRQHQSRAEGPEEHRPENWTQEPANVTLPTSDERRVHGSDSWTNVSRHGKSIKAGRDKKPHKHKQEKFGKHHGHNSTHEHNSTHGHNSTHEHNSTWVQGENVWNRSQSDGGVDGNSGSQSQSDGGVDGNLGNQSQPDGDLDGNFGNQSQPESSVDDDLGNTSNITSQDQVSGS